jgi:hypothetical protein
VDALAAAVINVFSEPDTRRALTAIEGIVREEIEGHAPAAVANDVSAADRPEGAASRLLGRVSELARQLPIARLLARAAARACSDDSAIQTGASHAAIERNVLHKLAEALVDALWLSRVRERVALATGRSIKAQLEWGADLLGKVGATVVTRLGPVLDERAPMRSESGGTRHLEQPRSKSLPYTEPEVICSLHRHPTRRTVSYRHSAFPTRPRFPGMSCRATSRFPTAEHSRSTTLV